MSLLTGIYIYIYIYILASQCYNERPRELYIYIYMRHSGLRYHITSLMMKTEMVLEKSVSFIHLTRLIA
jgi:hypothetical protein